MSDVVWQPTLVSKADRRRLNEHSSFTIWLTGLSGAGKSTIASALEKTLHESGVRTYLLDGDNLRHGLNDDLGFSEEARKENIRRASEVAKLFVDAGMVVIVGLISPMREDRERARERFEKDEFFEVFIDCPIEVCAERDPKGLYRRAMAGEIKNFTGVSAAYEPPLQPELRIESNRYSVSDSVGEILQLLERKGVLSLRSNA